MSKARPDHARRNAISHRSGSADPDGRLRHLDLTGAAFGRRSLLRKQPVVGGVGRPLRRRPGLRPDGAWLRRAGPRPGDGGELEGDRRDSRSSRRANIRKHDRSDGAIWTRSRPSHRLLRHSQFESQLTGVSRDPAQDGAEALRVLDDHPAEQSAVQPYPHRPRQRASQAVAPGSAASATADLRPVRPQRGQPRRRGQAALCRDPKPTGRAPHRLRQQHPRRRRRLRDLPDRGSARWLERFARPCRRGGRHRSRARGRVRDHQHPQRDGAVPDLLDRARPPRTGLADLHLPRGQRRRS